MKSILYITTILSLFCACRVMDVEPQDAISADAAFKDKNGIEKGILGSYNALGSLSYYGRTYILFSDLAADNLAHPADATASDYAEVDNNAILPENSAVDGIWSSIYYGINVANNVIDRVPGMSDMTEVEKGEALGELYFLRALNHFNLVNFFGAIPVKITPTVGVNNIDVPRDSVSKVFDQIISDLTFAENNLSPSSSNKIRASRYAATALLARVYLYEKNYTKAWEKSNDVITNGGYTFLTNYSDIFKEDKCAESIFEVDFTEQNRNRIAEYNFPKSLNGRREVAPDASLINAYESNDTRFATSVKYEGAFAYAIKYDDLSKGADNFIVLRLAEMYLIRAEAEAHKADAVISEIQDDINTIRNRAGLATTNAKTIDELLGAIDQERRVEFAFEGQRWFDLVRTGKATEVLPNVTNINKTLFPIPASELLTNNDPGMIQNPGY
jgi:starch-binding outer membrane protein, SusD/RagB family